MLFSKFISKRICLVLGLILCWLNGLILECAGAQDKAGIKRPNIVVILADDLGWSDLRCYGADLHETPVLDGLAREGVRFMQAYSAAPVCSPTRAALMTGMHPVRVGITIWSEGATKPDRTRKLLPAEASDYLDQKYRTLAEKLQAVGYRTGLVGKWHLGNGDNGPETQGFEVNVGGTRWGAPPTFFWPYRNNTRFRNEFRYVPGLPLGRQGDYLTDKLTDAAIRFVDEAGEEPFFVYLASYAPHTPIEAPAGLVEKYRGKLRPEFKHQNATYAGMIENLDTNVGRLIDHLKKTNRYEQTMIVFTSDNGGYLGDAKGRNGVVTTNSPLRSGKGALYEGGIRVPLIVKWPESDRKGVVIDERVVTMDVHASILGVAGVTEKADREPTDGVDLAGLSKGEGNAGIRDRALYFHYPHYYETTTPVSAVIEGDFKLLRYAETGKQELYDLVRDPYETSDIAHAERELVQRLAGKLNEWKRQAGAREPVVNPEFKGGQ